MSRPSRRHIVDVIAGDGIGPEVIAPTVAALDLLTHRHGFTISWRDRPWGSDFYRETGAMMPADGIKLMSDGDAVLLGAVGSPDIDDVTTLWGLLIPIRREFEQYVNLRPTRLLPGVTSAVSGAQDMDLLIVRENVEGEYSEIGGRFRRGMPGELAIQETVISRDGTSRAARFAANLAASRSNHLVSATKSNGIIHSMPFWDEVVSDVISAEFPSVTVESVLIDALAARLVQRPTSLDVIVASNLFGDILSDVAAAVAGSIGIAPSANLNPERDHPSLFEPVHGSAPDIAGQNLANPVGTMWAAVMMLDHLGEKDAAFELEAAYTGVLARGVATRDLGGSASTTDFAREVHNALES
jgi:tartrate dehydrogenase/decarboxylase/D-malate dehydrogenase